jgi:hypothetical protein
MLQLYLRRCSIHVSIASQVVCWLLLALHIVANVIDTALTMYRMLVRCIQQLQCVTGHATAYRDLEEGDKQQYIS